jgi:hypothetical protein
MRKPRSLIIAPFDDGGVRVQEALGRALEKLDIEVARFDHLSPGAVLANAVTDAIKSADFIVADVTNQSEWVLYELGFAHAMRKPTVLIASAQSKTGLPSNLSGFSFIVYEPDDLEGLADLVQRAVKPLAAETVARYV